MMFPLNQTFRALRDPGVSVFSQSHARHLCSTHNPFQIALLTESVKWLEQYPCATPQFAHTNQYTVETHQASVRIFIGEYCVVIDPHEHCGFFDTEPDLVVLTHAHRDHTSGIHRIHSAFPSVHFLTTAISWDFLSEQDALMRDLNERVGLTLPAFGNLIRFRDLLITSYPAGHLLGAAQIHLELHQTKILVSGDYSLRTVAGGLSGAWSRDSYDLVLLDGTHIADELWPTVHQAQNVESIITACQKAVEAGAHDIVFSAQALGHAQEVASAIATAQMKGLFPEYSLEVDGYATFVTQRYLQEISPTDPLQFVKSSTSRIRHPKRCIVTSSTNARNIQGLAPDAAIIQEGTDQGLLSVGKIYQTSAHASSRELLCTALALRTHNIWFYQCSRIPAATSVIHTTLSASGRSFSYHS